ncbi:MAG: hypothetical protein M1357_00590 [Candidatus Marsarchaeota archaeon]|nr:hypothetical protein [Candidatus Marsarchaeota archaeon]
MLKVNLGNRSFGLRVLKSNIGGEAPKGWVALSSDREVNPWLFVVAFHHACIRWMNGFSISKHLDYEFVVCLTGITRVSEIVSMKNAGCSKKYCYLMKIFGGEEEPGEGKGGDVAEDGPETKAKERVGVGVEVKLGYAALSPEDRVQLARVNSSLLSKL